MRSSKSRSRNKSNRQRTTLGNIVNRVFDSSGPEGKVRGTPQQIIEKYLTLARDAQLSNDRVAEQSFLQHAEHYTRMLGEAQREQAERQQHQNGASRDDDRDEAVQGDNGNANNGNGHQNGQNQRAERNDERREDRRDNRNDDRRDESRNENRSENRRDNRRDDRRDERREDRRDDRREDRTTSERTQPPAEDAGLPPVISAEEQGGPVETPETAQTQPAAVAPVEPAASVAAAPAATEAAAEPVVAEEVPAAPRRRTRSTLGTTTSATAGTTTAAAPRTRRKPVAAANADAAEAPATPATEKASGE